MNQELLVDWLRLVRSPGMGAVTLAYLIRHLGNFATVLTASQKTLTAIPGLRPSVCDTLAHFREHIPVAPVIRELERLHAMGGQVLILGEINYPPLLDTIHDPPPLLFALGHPEWLHQGESITVIGSRKASQAGLKCAFRMGQELAQAGIVTISGLAVGIDTAAHQGALAGSGPTVAVLATGLDVAYPKINQPLKQRIQANGCLITEAPLGVLPVPWLFPPRSRILSGLSRGVVVVEAKTRSGALMTARMALEQGREVFAVPGLANHPNSQGTHELLRQGACLTERVADILEALNWSIRPPIEPIQPKNSIPEQNAPFSGDTASVLACIEAGPIQEDELTRRCQLTVIALSRILLQLELSGLVKRLPGGQYTRV